MAKRPKDDGTGRYLTYTSKISKIDRETLNTLNACGIFVRNGKRVQLMYDQLRLTREGHHFVCVAGPTFKTFGKALKAAFKLGFSKFETDDGIILPITAERIAIANR